MSKNGVDGIGRYLELYRKDPARARREVWKTYLRLERRIRLTAKVLGCSRNTVRDVIERAGARRWDNRPPVPGPAAPPEARRRSRRIVVVRPETLPVGFDTRLRASAGVFLLKE